MRTLPGLDWREPDTDGLPAVEQHVILDLGSLLVTGTVDGLSWAIGGHGRFLWLREGPGLLTRVRVGSIVRWRFD